MPRSAPTPRPTALADLGRAVREIRRRDETSQETLAKRAGLHVNLVGRLERGTADVRLSTFMAVADALGVGLGELGHVYEARRAEADAR